MPEISMSTWQPAEGGEPRKTYLGIRRRSGSGLEAMQVCSVLIVAATWAPAGGTTLLDCARRRRH